MVAIPDLSAHMLFVRLHKHEDERIVEHVIFPEKEVLSLYSRLTTANNRVAGSLIWHGALTHAGRW